MYCQQMYMGKYFPRRRLFRFHVILSYLFFLLFECGSQTPPKRVTLHWHLLVWKKRKLRQRSSDSGCRQQPLHLGLSAAAFFRCSSNSVRRADPSAHTYGMVTHLPTTLAPVPAHISPTSSGLGNWKDQLTLLRACMGHQDTLSNKVFWGVCFPDVH